MADAEQPASKVELRQAVKDAKGILGESIFDRNGIREKIRSKPSVKEKELLDVVHEIIEDGVIESLEELALLHETKLRLHALARGRDGYKEDEEKALAYSRVLSAEYHPDILLRYYKKIELYLKLIEEPFIQPYLQHLSNHSKQEFENLTKLEMATAQHLRAVTPIVKQYVAIYNYLVLMKGDEKTPEKIAEAAQKIFPSVASEEKINPIGKITFKTPGAPAMEFSITSLTIPSRNESQTVENQKRLIDALALLQTDISRFTSMEPVDGIDITPFNNASPPDKLIETLISAVLTTQLRMGQEKGMSDGERETIQAHQDSFMKYLFDHMTTLGEDRILDLTTLILDMFEKKAEGDVTYKSTGSSPPFTPESRKQSDAEVNKIASGFTQHFEGVIKLLKTNAVLIIEDEYNEHGRLAALQLLEAMVAMRSVPRYFLGKLPLIPDTTLEELRTEMMGSLRTAWGLPTNFDIWKKDSLKQLTKEQWSTLAKKMQSTLDVFNANRENIVQNMEIVKADFDALLAFRAQCHYETLVRTDRDQNYYMNNKETKFTGKEFASLTLEQKRAAYEIILERLPREWDEYMEQNQSMLKELTDVIKVHNQAGSELEKLSDKTRFPWELILGFVGAVAVTYVFKNVASSLLSRRQRVVVRQPLAPQGRPNNFVCKEAREIIESVDIIDTDDTIKRKITTIEQIGDYKNDKKVVRWLQKSKEALRSPWVMRGAVLAVTLAQASSLVEQYGEFMLAKAEGRVDDARKIEEQMKSDFWVAVSTASTALASPSVAGSSFRWMASSAVRSPHMLLSLGSGLALSAPVLAAQMYSKDIASHLQDWNADERKFLKMPSSQLLGEISRLSDAQNSAHAAANGKTAAQALFEYLFTDNANVAEKNFNLYAEALMHTAPTRTAQYRAYFAQNTFLKSGSNSEAERAENANRLSTSVQHKIAYIDEMTNHTMTQVPLVDVLERADDYAALMDCKRILKEAKAPLVLEQLLPGNPPKIISIDLTDFGIDRANNTPHNLHNLQTTQNSISEYRKTMKPQVCIERLALLAHQPDKQLKVILEEQRRLIVGELNHAIHRADQRLLAIPNLEQRKKVTTEIHTQFNTNLERMMQLIKDVNLTLVGDNSYSTHIKNLHTTLENVDSLAAILEKAKSLPEKATTMQAKSPPTLFSLIHGTEKR